MPVYGLASTTDTSCTPALSTLNPVTEYWVPLVNFWPFTVTVIPFNSVSVIVLSVEIVVPSAFARTISLTLTDCGCTVA